jgi:hypothetical protein
MRLPTTVHPYLPWQTDDAQPLPGEPQIEGPRGAVRQVALPADARALSMLARIDYEDAFLVVTGSAQAMTGEQWARLMLEGAPIATRASLVSGWSALGLRLGSMRSDRYVLGWELRHSTPEFALLTSGSRIGMPAELLFKTYQDSLLFATLVQHQNAVARAMWAPVVPLHVQVVQGLLERGARAMSSGTP